MQDLTTLDRISTTTYQIELLERAQKQLQALGQESFEDQARDARLGLNAHISELRADLLDLVMGSTSRPAPEREVVCADCGLLWQSPQYSECPVCADQRAAEMEERVEIAKCSTCYRIFEVFDEDATCCPACEHDDRVYMRPISRARLQELIESGDAIAPEGGGR